MKWKDNRLKWIPANYENVRQVTAFRKLNPGSRPTYTFRYTFFHGHGLHKNIRRFSVDRRTSSAASYRKPFTFTVCGRDSRVNGLQKNHQPSKPIMKNSFKDKGSTLCRPQCNNFCTYKTAAPEMGQSMIYLSMGFIHKSDLYG
jgi:hypothetical protein